MAAICVGNYGSGGSGQYLLRSSISGSPNLRASHTFMVRMKHTQTSTSIIAVPACLLQSSADNGSALGRYGSGTASTAMGWWRGTGATVGDFGTCYGNTSTWYHLAFVYNASTQRIRAYIDGVYIPTEVTSSTTTSASSTNNRFIIGWMPGKYADAAMFDRALTDGEVADMAAYRVPQVTSGLLGFWRLDSDGSDSSGNSQNFGAGGSGTAVSYSTSDNPPQPESPTVNVVGTATSASTVTGTITSIKPVAGTAASASTLTPAALNTLKPVAGTASSASTLTPPALGVLKPLAATPGSASSLNAWMRPRWGRRIGTSGALQDSSAGFSPQSPFTVMTWVKPVELLASTDSAGFSVNDGAAGDGLQLWVRNTSGTIQNRISFVAGGSSVITYSAATDGNWHNLALTFDGANARAYVDGSLVATAAAAPNAPLFDFVSWGTLSSSLAEFAHTKIWAGVALTAAEITSEATYTTPHVANAQLYAWWQLAWNNVTLDSSGNGNTLTDSGSLEAQSESPGAPLTLVAGTAASASTITGALANAHALVSTATSASTLTGSTQARVDGSVSSASTLTGAVTQTQPLAATASSASTLTPAALQALIAAQADSVSTLTGSLGTTKPLAAQADSASTLTGLIGVQGQFLGVAFSASELTGSLNTEYPISGAISSASTLTGTLIQTHALVGTADTASTLSGAATPTYPAAGTLADASTLAGSLFVERPIAGDSASASTLTGATTANLTGVTLSSASTLTAALRLQHALAGSLQTSTALTGSLDVAQGAQGTARSASTLTGAVTVTQTPVLIGTARSASTFLASLRVTQTATAGGISVTNGHADMFVGVEPIIVVPRVRRWPPKLV